MRENRSMPRCSVIPELVYPDVEQAVAWLSDTFGFVERWRAGPTALNSPSAPGAIAVTEARTGQGWSDTPDEANYAHPANAN